MLVVLTSFRIIGWCRKHLGSPSLVNLEKKYRFFTPWEPHYTRQIQGEEVWAKRIKIDVNPVDSHDYHHFIGDII
jgi:hypothetical protein